jgi:quercetin 2,3-dioxygenase
VRTIDAIITAHRQLEGGGFPVRRPFPTGGVDMIDPFLLLDEMGPVDWPPGGAIGAPDHPHRGFETVTYILAGRLEHKDSSGHASVLAPGDVQWMTAGAGVVHSEMPEHDFKRSGGTMHGFQIWVNLPGEYKMMKPRYQDLRGPEIPVGRSDDGKAEVKVIAGEALGASAIIDTVIPIHFLHYTLAPGADVTQSLPPTDNALAYVFRGSARVRDRSADSWKPLEAGQAAVFGRDGDEVRLGGPEAGDPAELLLLSGRPIEEPVVRYGPFVMNTRREILEAIQDYQSGRMGSIEPTLG